METHKPIKRWISSFLHNNLHTWLPSRGNVVFTLVIVVALFWAQSVHALPWNNPPAVANSTNVWPYQGRLSDNSGVPITAAVPMTFKLYTALSGGTALWQEQWISVQVTGGLFNVMLGSQTAIPQSIVNNSNLWLGITVGTDSEMTPRVKLGSVPFAGAVSDGSITTAKIADGAITAAKQAPRLRTVSMQLQPDNCGGVGYYGHLGPMSSFAVGNSCAARGVTKLPYDWVVGTNLRIGILGRSRNSSQSANLYGDWATLNATDGNWNWEGYFSNTFTLGTIPADITLVNISSNDVSQGDTVVLYFYFPSNTDTVDVTGLYLEYTAQP